MPLNLTIASKVSQLMVIYTLVLTWVSECGKLVQSLHSYLEEFTLAGGLLDL